MAFEKTLQTRPLIETEKLRLNEILFYLIIKQIKDNVNIKKLPPGMTTTELLAQSFDIHIPLITSGANDLLLKENIPTKMEEMLLYFYLKLSLSQIPYDIKTYYRYIHKWKNQGMPTLYQKLSTITNNTIIEFNKKFMDTFVPKKNLFNSIKTAMGNYD